MPIALGLLARLSGWAAASPRREICGLLYGHEARIDDAELVANVAVDPARSFEIDPGALIAAHRTARAGGPRPIGCFHSHPSGDPTPSERDRAAAEPGSLWLILATGKARLWLAEPGGFRELTIRDDPVTVARRGGGRQ